MATKKTTKSNNPYAGKKRSELDKLFVSLERDYHESMSKGKLASIETAKIRRERAKLLTALQQSNLQTN